MTKCARYVKKGPQSIIARMITITSVIRAGKKHMKVEKTHGCKITNKSQLWKDQSNMKHAKSIRTKTINFIAWIAISPCVECALINKNMGGVPILHTK